MSNTNELVLAAGMGCRSGGRAKAEGIDGEERTISGGEDLGRMKITPRRVRLLLTYSCNAKCFYCHNEGQILPEKTLIDHVFVKNLLEMVDVHEIVLSGGEPTLNNDIENIARVISQKGGVHLSITTNGSNTETLRSLMPYLDKVRISIDTPDPEKYKQIKGLDLDRALRSLGEAKAKGIEVRINCPIASMGESLAMAEFGERTMTEIRFIELLDSSFSRPELKAEDLKTELLKNGYESHEENVLAETLGKGDYSLSLTKIQCMNSALMVNDGEAQEFCRTHTDLFITPSGKIKPCIHDDREIDIYASVMRKDRAGLEEKFKDFDRTFGMGVCRTS